jgi:hypothetical protein
MFLCFYDHLAPESLEHVAFDSAPATAGWQEWNAVLRESLVRGVDVFVLEISENV